MLKCVRMWCLWYLVNLHSINAISSNRSAVSSFVWTGIVLHVFLHTCITVVVVMLVISTAGESVRFLIVMTSEFSCDYSCLSCTLMALSSFRVGQLSVRCSFVDYRLDDGSFIFPLEKPIRFHFLCVSVLHKEGL